ncbi:hypothetical protein MLD38_020869 [Melastoma candidum]|uniref:Uncharacterized protein n=1 Tax=Melastoma candidum TaxID=119954 RepID=A0ACB9QE79_9MYRT|nr:hypothetical protein MLD38_020869 [Melastoma candidum]
MASKTSVPLVISMALLLLASALPAQADLLCEIGCLLRCSASLTYYIPCFIGCYFGSCLPLPPPPPPNVPPAVTPIQKSGPIHDPSIHCSLGCVTTTCLFPNFVGDKTARPSRGCITKCAKGCASLYSKN